MFEDSEAAASALLDVLTKPARRTEDLTDRLATITGLEGVLAAAKARTPVELHHAVPGVSADLGHEQPRTGDRAAEPGERRWCAGELRSVSDEVGLTVGVGRGTATRWIREAAALVERCPLVWARLAAGGVSPWAARAITAELAEVHDDTARTQAQQTVLDWAQRYGAARVRRAARREAVRADAELEVLMHEVRSDERRVRVDWQPYGMAELSVTAPAVDVAEALTAITRQALAAVRAGDDRTVDQLRADLALARLAGRGPDSGSPAAGSPESGFPDSAASPAGRRVGVVIHCTAAEAAGLLTPPAAPEPEPESATELEPGPADEVDWAPSGYGLPTGGELAVYGQLPYGAVARAWRTAQVRYRLTDTDPTADPTVHDPSTGLAEHVRDRDRGCRFPGCPAPPEACDLDHRVPFPHGPTTADNLISLCRHHHRLKHHGNWQVQPTPDGGLDWTDPHGRS